MDKKIAAFGVGAGTLALTVAAMGGIGLANAQDDNQSTPSERQQRGPLGPKGEPVTGETAEQARTAATEAVPGGEAYRVFARPDGGYAVGMTKSDGQRVVVLLTDSFELEDVKDRRDCKGPKGEPITGEAAQRAKAAAKEELPKSTPKRVYEKPDDGYAVLVKKQSGKKRVVLLDSDFSVEKVVNPKRGPGKPLSGDNKEKAEDAALEKVDGTVMRSVKKGKNIYVMVRTNDGGVLVTLDEKFKVVDTKNMPERERGFKGGPGKFGPPDAPAESTEQTTNA